MDKKSKYKKLSFNTFLFAFSSFGTKIISFIFVPLYTYVLSTQDYGMVDLVSSTVSLLIPLLTLNIQDAVLRFAIDKKYNSEDVLGVGIRVNLVAELLLFISLMVLTFSGVLKINVLYILFLFISFTLNALNNTITMYLKATNKLLTMVIGGIINTLLFCVLNIWFLLVLGTGVEGYLLAMVAGQMASLLFMVIHGNIYGKIHLNVCNELKKEMLIYSVPLVVNSISWWINNASDHYILTFFCGVAVNGIYSVAYKIPTILSTIQSIFYNAWSISAITEFDKDDSDGFLGNMFSLYSGGSCIVCSFIMICNIYIAKILYAKEFFLAWLYVPFLLVGTVFNGIALFEGCIFTAVKKTKEVSKTTIIGAIVNIILNGVLIFFIGPLGAAIATMVGYLTTCALRTWALFFIVKMKVNWKVQIMSYGIILLQSVIALNKKLLLLQIVLLIMLVLLQKKIIVLFLRKIKEKVNCC